LLLKRDTKKTGFLFWSLDFLDIVWGCDVWCYGRHLVSMRGKRTDMMVLSVMELLNKLTLSSLNFQTSFHVRYGAGTGVGRGLRVNAQTQHRDCCSLKVSPKSMCWKLNPKGAVWKGRSFKRWLGRGGSATWMDWCYDWWMG
jgi:hypothetical protein